jgi:hypothetical protein
MVSSLVALAEPGREGMVLSNTALALAIVVVLWGGIGFGRYFLQLLDKTSLRPWLTHWAAFFGALSLPLLAGGFYISMWQPYPKLKPEPHCCRAINLIFGMPSLWLGVVLVMLAGGLVWAERRLSSLPVFVATETSDQTTPTDQSPSRPTPAKQTPEGQASNQQSVDQSSERQRILKLAVTPAMLMIALIGPALFLIGVNGFHYKRFIPPPNEWYSFLGWRETWYVSIMFMLFGLGAILTPAAFKWPKSRRLIMGMIILATILLTLLTYAAFYGHMSLADDIPAPLGW